MRRFPLILLAVCLLAGAALPLTKGGHKMTAHKTGFAVTSVFADQSVIPVKYSCAGEGVNPPLTLSNAPASAKSLALTMEDPDAPRGVFDHWILYNIPPQTRTIGPGKPPEDSLSGVNSAGRLGYTPPCPPPGKFHHYIFTVYALDSELALREGAGKPELKKAMEGHVIARASLTGLFKR